MHTVTTIQAIRATIDQLNGQLAQYAREGEANLTKFKTQISSESAGVAVEAVANDAVGETLANYGSGKSLIERAIVKRRQELDVINIAKDKMVALKEDLEIVEKRFANRN